MSGFYHLHSAYHCPPLTVEHRLRVDIDRRGDASMPHLSLDVLRVRTGLRSST